MTVYLSSRIYRKSLNKSFYQLESGEEFGELAVDWNVFGNGGIKEQMHGDKENQVTVSFDVLISEDQNFVGVNLKCERKWKGDRRRGNTQYTNFVGKTARGTVRILNKTNLDRKEIGRIKKCLSQEPAGEESGITLWPLNCCIKRAIVGYIRQALEREDINGVKHRIVQKGLTGNKNNIIITP